jgi:hypothetical protein
MASPSSLSGYDAIPSQPGSRWERGKARLARERPLWQLTSLLGAEVEDVVVDSITPSAQSVAAVPELGELCPISLLPPGTFSVKCGGIPRHARHRFASAKSWDEVVHLLGSYDPVALTEVRTTKTTPLTVMTVHRRWMPVLFNTTGSIGEYEVTPCGVSELAKLLGYNAVTSYGAKSFRLGGLEFPCDDAGTVTEGFFIAMCETLARLTGMRLVPRRLNASELEMLPYAHTLFGWKRENNILMCGLAQRLTEGTTTLQSEVFSRINALFPGWRPRCRYMFDGDLLSLAFLRDCPLNLDTLSATILLLSRRVFHARTNRPSPALYRISGCERGRLHCRSALPCITTRPSGRIDTL